MIKKAKFTPYKLRKYIFLNFYFRRMKWKKENKSKLDGGDLLDEDPDSN